MIMKSSFFESSSLGDVQNHLIKHLVLAHFFLYLSLFLLDKVNFMFLQALWKRDALLEFVDILGVLNECKLVLADKTRAVKFIHAL